MKSKSKQEKGDMKGTLRLPFQIAGLRLID